MAVERAVRNLPAAPPAGPSRRRFTVDEYYLMAKAGILGEKDRVELIEGEIVEMPPIGPEHAGGVDDLYETVRSKVGTGARVRSQNPVRLAPKSEPEPDIAVVRLVAERGISYREAHPTPADVYLLIEVADSSLEFDLGGKADLYARHGIPELWVVDLVGERVVVHREPTATGYAIVTEHRRGDTISPLAFPDLAFAIDDVLG